MRREILLVTLILSILIISLVGAMFIPSLIPSVKQNPKWLSGWTYRKSHTISSASGAGTDYQVLVRAFFENPSELPKKIVDGGMVQYRSVCQQAWRFVGSYDKTYFVWFSSGSQYVASYDNENGNIGSTLVGEVGNDDHATPSILVRSDGHILVFLPQSTGHSAAILLRISNNPEDISSFGDPIPVKTRVSAYPRPWQTSSGKIGLLTRYAVSATYCKEELTFSMDGGETWGEPITLVDYGKNKTAYGVVFQEIGYPDRLHYVGFYLNTDGYRYGLWYMRSLDGGESWQRIDGTPITLPANNTNMDLVWNIQSIRVLDVIADENHNPYILVAQPITAGLNPIIRIKYENGEWVRETITNSKTFYGTGEDTYTAGAIFDCLNPNRVFISAASGAYTDMQIWEQIDGTWTKTKDLTKTPGDWKIRPQVPRNRHPNFQVFWARGTYNGYGDWNCSIYKYPGESYDYAEKVGLNGHCRTDFGDVRFTAGDGTTLLDYWMEEKVDGKYAEFWVKVPNDLSTNPATIYIYYGNPTATTTSSGDNTFLFFDNFITLNSSKWTFSGNYSIVDGTLRLHSTTSYHSYARSTNSFPANTAIKVKWKTTYLSSLGIFSLGYDVHLIYNDAAALSNYAGATKFRGWQRRAGGTRTIIDLNENRDYEWHASSIMRNGNTSIFYLLDDEGNAKQLADNQVPLVDIPILLFARGEGYEAEGYVDWVFVRKYVNPEPSHGAWGSEETSTTYLRDYSFINFYVYFFS